MIKLPHKGLDTLERLRIQNTHSLKTIPTLLHFRSLQEAHLTHSFHCCAFKYPARHDPKLYAERQQQKEKILKLCAESSTKANPEVTELTRNDVWSESGEIWGTAVETESKVKPLLLVRKKRRRRAIEEDLHSKYIPIM